MRLQSLDPNEGNFPASYKHKKWRVVIDNRTIYFGDNRYEDYTQHHNLKRRNLYLDRHKEREDWNDPLTAGFWAANLLWNKKSLVDSFKDIVKRFPDLL